MEKIMFDSNVFDKLPNLITKIKENISTIYEVYITVPQIEEICNIPDKKKEQRFSNMLMLADLRAKLVPISVFIFGKAHLGYACLGSGEVYYRILNESKNNINDSIIADTAVKENCTLITEDIKLIRKMKKYNYSVMSLSDFLTTFPT